jgi:predicted nucleic acid-binding protein
MMVERRRTIYWDSSLFLHLLAGDRDVVPVLVRMIDEIQRTDRFRIVTSTFSIVEVAFLLDERANGRLTPDFEATVDRLWADTTLLRLAEFDQETGRLARGYTRAAVADGRALKPIDAIHLATATIVGAEVVLTTDERLVKRGREVGVPIGPPDDSVLALLRR